MDFLKRNLKVRSVTSQGKKKREALLNHMGSEGSNGLWVEMV